MQTVVVYDSVYGNTEQVAMAVSRAIGWAVGAKAKESVATFRVKDVRPAHLQGVKLLIVGSPTHRFRPTETIAHFLASIPAGGLKGVKVMAFDTRVSIEDKHSRLLNLFVKLSGFAAQPIAKALKKKGGTLLVPPEGFYVDGTEGPLKDGELARAAVWASNAARGLPHVMVV